MNKSHKVTVLILVSVLIFSLPACSSHTPRTGVAAIAEASMIAEASLIAEGSMTAEASMSREQSMTAEESMSGEEPRKRKSF